MSDEDRSKRRVVDADGRKGVLDLGVVGLVTFTPDGGSPEPFAWRVAKALGARGLLFSRGSDTRFFIEVSDG